MHKLSNMRITKKNNIDFKLLTEFHIVQYDDIEDVSYITLNEIPAIYNSNLTNGKIMVVKSLKDNFEYNIINTTNVKLTNDLENIDCFINFKTGHILFPNNKVGDIIVIKYWGMGSIIKSEHINNLYSKFNNSQSTTNEIKYINKRTQYIGDKYLSIMKKDNIYYGYILTNKMIDTTKKISIKHIVDNTLIDVKIKNIDFKYVYKNELLKNYMIFLDIDQETLMNNYGYINNENMKFHVEFEYFTNNPDIKYTEFIKLNDEVSHLVMIYNKDVDNYVVVNENMSEYIGDTEKYEYSDIVWITTNIDFERTIKIYHYKDFCREFIIVHYFDTSDKGDQIHILPSTKNHTHDGIDSEHIGMNGIVLNNKNLYNQTFSDFQFDIINDAIINYNNYNVEAILDLCLNCESNKQEYYLNGFMKNVKIKNIVEGL